MASPISPEQPELYSHLDADVSSSESTSPSSADLSGHEYSTLDHRHTHKFRQRPHTPPSFGHHGLSREHSGEPEDHSDLAYGVSSGVTDHFAGETHKRSAREQLQTPRRPVHLPLPIFFDSEEEDVVGEYTSRPKTSAPSNASSKFPNLPRIITDSHSPHVGMHPLPHVTQQAAKGDTTHRKGDMGDLKSRWSPDSSVVGSTVTTGGRFGMQPLKSRWSPDSSVAGFSARTPFSAAESGRGVASLGGVRMGAAVMEREGRSPLENHLEFVSSVSRSPGVSRAGTVLDARMTKGGEKGMTPVEQDITEGGAQNYSEGLEADDEGEVANGYDTESTLSLASTPAETPSGSPAVPSTPRTPGTPGSAQRRMGKTPVKGHSGSLKTQYTHGHALQRMPGKVKGFGEVPHYHFQVHRRTKGRLGKEVGKRLGSPFGKAAKLGHGDEDEAEHVVEDLGSAFLNLNLSETGRDVRVLVRSKQMRAKAGGGDLKQFDKIIDELMMEEPMLFEETDDLYHRKLIMYPRHEPRFMIKRLQVSASELLVLLELNQSELRGLDWNPALRVVCAVDRPRMCLLSDKGTGDEMLGRPDDDVFLFFEPLEELEKNASLPRTVEGWLDMFQQLLEGLTFLHEHHIAGFRCNLLRSFMRSRSVAVSGLPSHHDSTISDEPPVRYRFVDFADARRVSTSVLHVSPGDSNPASVDPLVEKDVKDLGVLFQRLLDEHVEELEAKMSWLVREMTRGGVTANEALLALVDLRQENSDRAVVKDDTSRLREGIGGMSGGHKHLFVPAAGITRSISDDGTYDLEKEQEAVRHPVLDDDGPVEPPQMVMLEEDRVDSENSRSSQVGESPKWILGLQEDMLKAQEGRMTAKFSVPTLGNARLTCAEIVPEDSFSVEKN